MVTPAAALAIALAKARELGGLRQQEVADAMRRRGWPWHRATVSAVEAGRRTPDVFELAALGRVLGLDIGALLDTVTLDGNALPVVDEVTEKAARTLGISTAEVDRRATVRWGRNLSEEREHRLGAAPAQSPRSRQAQRGHVTRKLLAELRSID